MKYTQRNPHLEDSVDTQVSDGWMKRLAHRHAGRSWVRLTIYIMVLLILAPISVACELLRDFFDSAAERVNDLGNPLQKWAYSQKPNANMEARDQ